ncbi:MAG: filamentous hemagglutinin N-terminal domain-containing protein, partial [Phycisphaerales bacterium]
MNRSTLTPRRLAESAGRLASVLGLAAGLALTPDARAQVQGAQVVSGSATINSSGGHTVITAGHNAIINYQAFNIQAGQSVQFIQPGASARVLNRITGPDPTTIAGSLTANGIVYIANPAGVYFAHGALVDVGGIYAAAGSITNADFIGNINRFTQMSGVVENRGTIQGGTVALIGARAANFGTIATPANGMVTLAAGSEVYLADGDKRIMAKVAPANIGEGAGVTNAGTISAPKGRVSLGAGDMYALAIDQRGTISARDVSIRGGQGGVVSVSGTVSVAGTQPGEKGGRIEVLGDKVGLFGGTLDASGPAGGGEILVGGNYQGKGAEPNASATYISHDARIRADATGKGNGGRIIVWSDFSTRVYGQLSARGGALAGNGGFIETSGANLDVRGTPDLTAARGLGGTWLIDPRNVTIDQVANSSGFPVIPPTSPFVPDADGAILDIDDLLAALSGGANVIVQTGAGGAELGNITLATTLDFNGLGSNSLSLIAHNDIIINAQILDSVAGGGDLLNLTLTANSDAAGGGMVRVNQSISLGGGSFTASGDGVELSAGLDAGALTFNAPVILKADTILAGTSIAFNDTLDTDGTAWDLTLNTSGAGATTFAGRVGDTDALGVLTTNADGSTVVDTDVVNADTIALNDAVLIGVDSVFTTTSGTTFGGMLNSETDEANDLTLNGPVAFNGAVGADTGGATTQGALGTLTASDAASISGASMRAAVLDFADAVTVKANTTLTGTTSITFQSTLDCEQNLGRTLALNSPLTTFGNQVGFLDTNSGFVSLTTDAAGTTNINTDRVKAGVLTLNDAAVIGVDTILIGTTSVSLAQVDSAAALARSLTINSPTTLFSGQVGNAAGGTLGTLSTNSAGTTTINTGVIKAATLDFQDAVVIAADTTLTGAAAFASTVNSEASEANDLILVGATTFNGVVGGAANGALGELNVSGGTASINAADISAATMQFGATVLRTSTTLTGTGVTFSSTVDSEAAEANSLTVSATTLSFQGVVGGAVSGELGTLTTTGTTTTINAPTIEAATMFFGATQLDTSVTLTGTAVTFGSTLNSQASEANSLTVTASTLALNGAVGAAANGALGTLTATAATTTINTASVNAATMLFGVTVLEASTTLAGTSVSFSSTLNSAASEANSLTVNAGTLLLNGVVGRAPNRPQGTHTPPPA